MDNKLDLNRIKLRGKELKERMFKYRQYASFAIWDPKDQQSLEILKDEEALNKLHNNVVFLALNASKETHEDWSMFRLGKYDYRLAKSLPNTPYEGAYMTDIFKYGLNNANFDPANASETVTYFKDNPELFNKNIVELKKELKLLGNPPVVAFGGATKKILAKELPYIEYQDVYHYSYRFAGYADDEIYYKHLLPRLAEFAKQQNFE